MKTWWFAGLPWAALAAGRGVGPDAGPPSAPGAGGTVLFDAPEREPRQEALDVGERARGSLVDVPRYGASAELPTRLSRPAPAE
jgi:hypothetical protein